MYVLVFCLVVVIPVIYSDYLTSLKSSVVPLEYQDRSSCVWF